MSRTLLADLAHLICAEVHAFLPDLARCAPHWGRFSLETLRHKGLPSPSVLVSVLGARQDTTCAGHATSFMVHMAAYVVVRDGLGAPRDARAATICQLLLTLIPGRHWHQEAIGEARSVHMHTLISEKTKDHAVSLWAVTWDQPISFFEPPDGPLGVKLYVARAPAVGADHAADYTEIGGQG